MRTSLAPSFAIAAILLLFSSTFAAESEAPKDLVQASLIADVDAATPGSSFTLGVLLKMQPHWHTYWINPGETGNATQFVFHGPAGFEFGPVGWPLPSKIESGGGVIFGYEKEVLFLIPVKVAKDVAASGAALINVDVTWLSCKETCIEGGAKLAISLPISLNAHPASAELFNTWKQRLPIPMTAAPALEALAAVKQAEGADGSPLPELAVQWKSAVRNVEWFPISTDFVVVENVVIHPAERESRINFKVTVYKPESVPGGRLDSVLVYEDAAGRRHGISLPVKVTKK